MLYVLFIIILLGSPCTCMHLRRPTMETSPIVHGNLDSLRTANAMPSIAALPEPCSSDLVHISLTSRDLRYASRSDLPLPRLLELGLGMCYLGASRSGPKPMMRSPCWIRTPWQPFSYCTAFPCATHLHRLSTSPRQSIKTLRSQDQALLVVLILAKTEI